MTLSLVIAANALAAVLLLAALTWVMASPGRLRPHRPAADGGPDALGHGGRPEPRRAGQRSAHPHTSAGRASRRPAAAAAAR